MSVHLGDHKCVLKLFSLTGGSEAVAWYQIWEATTAVFSVCGRASMGGSYRGLGTFWLSVFELGMGVSSPKEAYNTETESWMCV